MFRGGNLMEIRGHGVRSRWMSNASEKLSDKMSRI